MDNIFIKNQLKQLLIDTLPKQYRNDNTVKQRKFLIDCIEQQGYIVSKKSYVEHEESEHSEYEQDVEPEDYYTTEDYSRTFLQDNERLTKIQQRGITQEETDFNKIKEIVDITLNAISRDYQSLNIDSVKKIAMSMYKKILNYYKNPKYPEIKSNLKGVKKGYVVLIIYFALLEAKYNIPKEKLLTYFEEEVLPSNLFNAEKYIRLIIPNLPNINPYLSNLCGLRDKLDKNIVNEIYEVIEKLPDKNTKNIAAAIYYVGKGKVTLKTIGEHCKISSSTISNAYKEISTFLK